MPKRKVGIKTHLLTAYIFLGLLPMLIIAVYTYHSTGEILTKQMTEQVEAQVEQEVKAIDDLTGRFAMVADVLYSDSNLYDYLTTDYSDGGFEDMFFYVRKRIAQMKMLYPEIVQLSFYCTNETLPRDIKHFYYIDENDTKSWDELTKDAGAGLSLVLLKEDRVSFIKNMNLYGSGSYRLFIRLDINMSTLELMLGNSESSMSYLEFENRNFTIPEDAKSRISDIQDNIDTMLVSRETRYCGTLVHYENLAPARRQVRESAGRVFLVYFITMIVAVSVIYWFSSKFKKNVDRIIEGAREIGNGNLSYRIPVTGVDELGQISDEFNELGERLDALIEDSYKKEIARRGSDMNLLQEQINPHFLYNALASISSLARKNQDKETVYAISCLADFYRISLNKGKQVLSVREEIDLLKSYLKIQKIRFGEVVQVEYDLDESLMDKEVIKLILQPIVENAIHHGRYEGQEILQIRIQLQRKGEHMIISVCDDGKGIDAEQLMELQENLNRGQEGIGLYNVNARIKLQYGNEYGVYLESQPFLGTIVTVELPIRDKMI